MVEDFGEALQPYIRKIERTRRQMEKTGAPSGTSLMEICTPSDYVEMGDRYNRFLNIPMAVRHRPIEPANPLLWFGVLRNVCEQRGPTEDEESMCACFVLAVVHDYEFKKPRTRPIFPRQYNGKWLRRDAFREFLAKHYHYPDDSQYYGKSTPVNEEKVEELELDIERVKRGLRDKGLLSGDEAKPASVPQIEVRTDSLDRTLQRMEAAAAQRAEKLEDVSGRAEEAVNGAERVAGKLDTIVEHAGTVTEELREASRQAGEGANEPQTEAGEDEARGQLGQPTVPRGYIGSKDIINSTVRDLKERLDLPVQGNDKHKIPRSTLEYWQKCDDVAGGPLEGNIKYDPSTHEVWYPMKWLKTCLKEYTPRTRKP
jgi:hypothetical protein